jgi:hypothetical protein
MMTTDNTVGDELVNTFQDNGTGAEYPGHDHLEYSKDVSVQVLVDNPFSPELRRYDDVVLNWWERNLDYAFFCPKTKVAATNLMTPSEALPGTNTQKATWGVAMSDEGLNIPIHARSRVKVAVLIPVYDEYGGTLESPWGSDRQAGRNPEMKRCWNNQRFTLTITTREELLSGKG